MTSGHASRGLSPDEYVVFVGGQIAVAVIGGGSGAADGGDFVLFIGSPCLRGAVGGDGVPVADGVVVPGLAV